MLQIVLHLLYDRDQFLTCSGKKNLQTKQTQENTKKKNNKKSPQKSNIVSKIILKNLELCLKKGPPQNTQKSLSKTGLIIPIFIQDGLKINTYYYCTHPGNRKNILLGLYNYFKMSCASLFQVHINLKATENVFVIFMSVHPYTNIVYITMYKHIVLPPCEQSLNREV